jgi:DNA gyrase/topoisomerase IV subunit A
MDQIILLIHHRTKQILAETLSKTFTPNESTNPNHEDIIMQTLTQYDADNSQPSVDILEDTIEEFARIV